MSPNHCERYYARVKKMGLASTNVPTAYRDRENQIYHVPSPEGRTPEELEETLERLARLLGATGRHE